MKLAKHSTSRAPRSRPGFTLVELMVVIAIIGVVVTLAASATMQVVTRLRTADTELTIQKVNEALKAHWQAVTDQAKTEQIPNSVLYGDNTMLGLLAMAGGDADPDSMRRARLIWIKLRLKQQFPMNFMEALDPTPNTIKPSGGRPYVLLPPAPVFTQALLGKPTLLWPVGQTPPPTALAANLPQNFESSVCLLLAISQAHNGVPGFDQDRLAATEKADSGVNGLKEIVDGWGRPLTFYRWPIGGEVSASNPNKTSSAIIGDPLDPDGLLMSPRWNTPTAYTGRGGVWAFEKLFHPVHDGATNKPVSYYTVPVIASAGPVIGTKPPNQPYLNLYDLMGLPAPQERAPAAPLPTPLVTDPMDMASGKPDSQDNIYSFRMRLGARGD